MTISYFSIGLKKGALADIPPWRSRDLIITDTATTLVISNSFE